MKFIQFWWESLLENRHFEDGGDTKLTFKWMLWKLIVRMRDEKNWLHVLWWALILVVLNIWVLLAESSITHNCISGALCTNEWMYNFSQSLTFVVWIYYCSLWGRPLDFKSGDRCTTSCSMHARVVISLITLCWKTAYFGTISDKR